ncbi:MAG: response regulator transcription factor [Phenylobacterium sp.]|uniref:response regulator transcription factor n=1 Tax=Phenylobacterium sp. TaxID=1871053 RepID=UPI001A61F5C7|nr:response regulator transcription factor [Phenylobacterium sp.]MBL8771958.1 response regulator transcription factor [Phenylobacterium sp.]
MSLAEGRRRRVLVVDDDAYLTELLVTRLELAGFETRSARNGSAALSRLQDFKPEAMVLDINMPVLDGFGVLSQMKAQGLSDKVPTMVLTARNAAEDVAKAIRLGAKDYLAKPFRDEALIARVGRLLQRPRG